MSRVTWGDPGARFYETGVDRGVLYINNVGVAWSGITSISESPTGGEAKPYYMDGIKYLNIAGSEEFAATLEALAAPAEFGPCDGSLSINKGLFATQQPRKAFSLSYRTLIGNDTQGQNLGYKIHLVYNALAAPSERSRTTTGDEADPTTHSWSLTTLPPSLTGMKPTAHFVIDSRTTPKGLLSAVEDILYGSDVADARLPMPSELITMFQSEGPVTRINEIINPNFQTYVAATEVRRNVALNAAYRTGIANSEIRRNAFTDPRISSVATWSAGITTTGPGGAKLASSGAYSPNVTAVAGEMWTVSALVTSPSATSIIITLRPTTGSSFGTNPYLGTSVPVVAGVPTRVSNTYVLPAGTDGLRVYMTTGNVADVLIDQVMFEKAPTMLPYFDGSTPAADGLTYSWVGTVNASASIASGSLINSNTFKGYVRSSWRVPGGATDGTDSALAYIGSTQSVGVSANPLLLFSYDAPAAVAGDVMSHRFRARLRNATLPLTLRPYIYAYNSSGGSIGMQYQLPDVILPANGDWVDVVLPNATRLALPALTASARMYVTTPTSMIRQDIIETSNVLVEKGEYPGPWFDGSTPAADGVTYSWASTANASASIAMASRPSNWAAASGEYLWSIPGVGSMIYKPVYSLNSFYYLARTVDPLSVHTTAATFTLPASAPSSVVVFCVSRTYDTVGVNLGWYESTRVTLQPGQSARVSVTITTEANAKQLRPYFVMNGAGYCVLSNAYSGLGTDGEYFDGNTLDADNYFYKWEGAVNASRSIENTWN